METYLLNNLSTLFVDSICGKRQKVYLKSYEFRDNTKTIILFTNIFL